MAWQIILRGESGNPSADEETELLHKAFSVVVQSLNKAGLGVVSGNASGANAASMNVDEVPAK